MSPSLIMFWLQSADKPNKVETALLVSSIDLSTYPSEMSRGHLRCSVERDSFSVSLALLTQSFAIEGSMVVRFSYLLLLVQIVSAVMDSCSCLISIASSQCSESRRPLPLSWGR